MKELDLAIGQGIDYLFEHQMPSGEFALYRAPDDAMQEYCTPDSTVFPASLIAGCLLPLTDREKVKIICSRTAKFLSYQMMRGGLWNHFTRWNMAFTYSPADADDTAIASFVLRALGVSFPDNRDMMLSNRNSDGLFYTWYITRHINQITGDYRRSYLREFKNPVKSILFWVNSEARRKDVDAVVNSNILYYLGYDDQTKAIVPFLLKTIRDEQEGKNDKWYRNPIVFYYFFSRNYGKVRALESARETILQRIYNRYQEDGRVGESVLSTALALSAVLNFGDRDDRIHHMVRFLLNAQQEAGCWDRYIFYYGGPLRKIGFGSEELTTAHCVEALYKFQISPLARG